MELDAFDAFVPVSEATTLMRRKDLEAAQEPALP
jgi:hypothetical protein